MPISGLDATLIKDGTGLASAQDVKSCTGIKTDDAVTVNWYSDGGSATASLPVCRPRRGIRR
jgi:hypothetical protein